MHFEILIEVEPGAVRARLVVESIGEDPLRLLRVERDTSLAL